MTVNVGIKWGFTALTAQQINDHGVHTTKREIKVLDIFGINCTSVRHCGIRHFGHHPIHQTFLISQFENRFILTIYTQLSIKKFYLAKCYCYKNFINKLFTLKCPLKSYEVGDNLSPSIPLLVSPQQC